MRAAIVALVLALATPAASQPRLAEFDLEALEAARVEISVDDVLIDVAPDAAEHLARLDALGDTAEDGSRIDVLVAYTPTVVERGGGLAPTEALIDLLVEGTNRAYRDSGVIQRINLVSAVEVDYRETGDNYADLLRAIRPSDGHMDELHEIREREAADIVALLAYHPDSRVSLAGGYLSERLAFILFSLGPGNWPDYSRFPDWMAAGFAHELGHVMGSGTTDTPCRLRGSTFACFSLPTASATLIRLRSAKLGSAAGGRSCPTAHTARLRAFSRTGPTTR